MKKFDVHFNFMFSTSLSFGPIKCLNMFKMEGESHIGARKDLSKGWIRHLGCRITMTK